MNILIFYCTFSMLQVYCRSALLSALSLSNFS
ncbi:MAG: hypothetical protein ACJAXH_003292 [Colwellia sp.]